MHTCLIGLGANLGDRLQTLDTAVASLARDPRLVVVAQSRWHESSAIGGPPGQLPYLNGVVKVETSLEPPALMAVLQRIENALGRRRLERWAPRTIDLDLLLYDQLVLNTPLLVLPHPRMAWRRFVLEPAAEVAGCMVHPTTGWTIARLLDHLNTTAPYLAIAGPIGVGKTHLARRLARKRLVRWVSEKVDSDQLETFYSDPSGNAWSMELEFLRKRARLLEAGRPEWSDPEWVASDFWFNQSLALAAVWLPPEQQAEFRRRWQTAQAGVVRPRLTVLLDASTDRLLERVRRRGRRCERHLGPDVLEKIRQAILAQAAKPEQGPMLRLTYDNHEAALCEVQAAIQAME